MKKKGLGSLITILVLAGGGLIYTFVAGNEPLLGLDLQGGASVVLKPSNDVEDDTLDQAIEIIRSRVDALGVAEPDISRQGDTILVQLPGVDNQQRALDLVGQTAELRFRPVCQFVPLAGEGDPTTPSTSVPGGGSTTSAPPGGATTTSPPPTTATSATDGEGSAPAPGFVEGESAAGLQGPPTTAAPPTTAPPATTIPGGTTPPTIPPAGEPSEAAGCTAPPEDVNRNGISRRRFDRNHPDRDVILPLVDPECEPDSDDPTKCWDGIYWLGPTALTGEALSDASATFPNNEWVVSPTFKGGEDGIDKFNAIAAVCNAGQPACPAQQGSPGQLAIVLDSEVISAPAIQQANFERDGIQISGSFDEGSAKDLALVLRYGALPVELEPQQTQTVSATLGEDALRAGLIAGFVGLGIAALFMIAYYRLLGVLAIASLAIGAALLWTIISYLGETRGLALTLAGVTGIIVSIGISLDSNVVYYEHLKEDVRNGRTLRSSVERSFDSAFSTIVKADSASLIGAALLYFLTVGAVRGFAFYLGLAAALDLVAFYFFMRPAATLLVRSKRLGKHPNWFGIPETAPEQPVDAAVKPAPEGAT